MESYKGMDYIRPKVYLLADTGIGNAEFAARTCYNSFDKSENDDVKRLNDIINDDDNSDIDSCISGLRDVEGSDLLKQLSFVHFHHSVLEHNVVTFFIQGTSRGVLQELARHRIASYSVKSTRYTLDELMYNFIVALYVLGDTTIAKEFFIEKSLELDLFVTADEDYNKIELAGIWSKLMYHRNYMDDREFLELIVPKSNIDDFLNSDNDEEAYEVLQRKKKRNIGDAFKHVITDNFKTDLTMTINLRALKNFFDLRLSGAAWFQIQWLAQGMKEVLPEASKTLIFKEG